VLAITVGITVGTETRDVVAVTEGGGGGTQQGPRQRVAITTGEGTKGARTSTGVPTCVLGTTEAKATKGEGEEVEEEGEGDAVAVARRVFTFCFLGERGEGFGERGGCCSCC